MGCKYEYCHFLPYSRSNWEIPLSNINVSTTRCCKDSSFIYTRTRNPKHSTDPDICSYSEEKSKKKLIRGQRRACDMPIEQPTYHGLLPIQDAKPDQVADPNLLQLADHRSQAPRQNVVHQIEFDTQSTMSGRLRSPVVNVCA